MKRIGVITAGFLTLAGCGDGGAPEATLSGAPRVIVQPDIITATPQELLRGKANGDNQQLIFSRPNMHQLAFFGDLFLSSGLVYYPREAPSLFFDWPNQDIWTVRTDGTDDHAVVETTANEFVKDASGNIAIYEQGTYALENGLDHTEFWSVRDGVQHTLLPIHERFTNYRFMVGARAFFHNEQELFSVNVNGSGLLTHATVRFPVTLQASDSFENTLIFREYNGDNGRATLKAVPISGRSTVSLDDGQTYVAYAGHVGARVVYQRCTVQVSDPPGFSIAFFQAGPCDVVSVHTNGSAPAVLASHSANEAVQGLMETHVIIRRNLNGNDQLIAVPVTGGPERLLMTMTDSEFVNLIAGELIIIGRPSGTWTLDLTGTLKQIGNVQAHSGFMVVGNSFCMNNRAAAWCMPLDGQSPAVKIADVGKVVGTL
ncbi:MAG: hypothetical protein EHM80_08475 [Nitrospiraceae bacterium]|nr:MAG: hypothetical protein EHM80_08475 [Nitrospiraceae bacterium]